MLRSHSDSFRRELLAECKCARALGASSTRLAGLCTLAALLAWGYGGLWVTSFMKDRLIALKLSQYVGHSMHMQDQSDPYPLNSAVDVSGVADPVEEAQRLLEESRVARQQLHKARINRRAEMERFNKQMTRENTAQWRISLVWAAGVITAGLFLLGAALAGMMGSTRARRWHFAAALWMLLATAGTLGCMWALTRWGGFPPIPDSWILVKIGAVQSSYAIVILVVLLLTLRTEPDPARRPL